MDDLIKPHEFLENVIKYDEERDLRGFTTIGIKMGSVNWWLGLNKLFQFDINNVDFSSHLPVTLSASELIIDQSNVGCKTLNTQDRIALWIRECQNIDGGVGPNIKHRSSIGATFQALSILCMLGYLPSINKNHQYIKELLNGSETDEEKELLCINGYKCPLNLPKLLRWILSMKENTRWGTAWRSYADGPILVENTAQVCIIASLLGCIELIDSTEVRSFVHQCFNSDGGFGEIPGMESHGAFTYASLITLKLLKDDFMTKDRIELLSMWLCARHLDESGGINGRPEKFPDVCYTWFIIASLALINKTDVIDITSLSSFIKRSQETGGGIADRPGNVPDLWHTWYGFSGLSLLKKDEKVETLSPLYCLPVKSLQSIGVETEDCSL